MLLGVIGVKLACSFLEVGIEQETKAASGSVQSPVGRSVGALWLPFRALTGGLLISSQIWQRTRNLP
jgi:hypothetical protein